MPGGAGLILLLACLVPAPLPSRPAGAGAAIDESLDVRESRGPGVAPSGTVVGECAGTVLVEVQDATGMPLARTQARAGRWSMPTVGAPIATLRYGCDEDKDGFVPAREAVEISSARLPGQGVVLVLMPE